MRFRSLHRWNLNDDIVGLLFFCQKMEELLFDYTIDSYKPSTLNAPYLCIEALALIDDIEENLIKEENLSYVLNELEWSIINDQIAKKMLDLDLSYYILKDDRVKLKEKKKKIEVLSRTLDPLRYLDRCKKSLANDIECKNKKNIDFVSKTMVTTLINLGYSKEYLYNSLLECFFVGDGPIVDSCRYLSSFFEYIDVELHRYEVVFLVDPLVNSVKNSVKSFGIDIYRELPDEIRGDVESKGLLRKDISTNYEYVVIKNILAFDHITARYKASRRIDNLSDLFSLFYHKSQIKWLSNAVVRRMCCDKVFFAVNSDRKVMEKVFDYKPEKASKALNKLISTFAMSDSDESFDKFNRVADLHGICITNNNILENQIVNLWTAIETLVPSYVGDGRINNIINSIIPFIVIGYTNRILYRFVADLITWNKGVAKKILAKVPNSYEKGMVCKSLYLLSIDGNNDLRNELYASLKDFHLLRFRAYTLSDIFSNVEKIKKLISDHEIKVSWQIRRIYRTRNIVVHSAQRPKFIESLIENGHDYLDQVLQAIMFYSCGEYSVRSIEQSFEIAKIKHIKFNQMICNMNHIDENSISFLCEKY